MKKIILILLIGFSILSCKSENEKLAEENKRFLDSLKISDLARERTEEIILKSTKDRYLDTTGTGNSPVKVISSRLVKKEYSNYKDIELTFKNTSNKDIEAIRFEWYGENSFKEPADMGSYTSPGEGGGFSEDLLKSGKTETGTWNISSKDAKKIIAARAYEVVFKDGTIWKLRKD